MRDPLISYCQRRCGLWLVILFIALSGGRLQADDQSEMNAMLDSFDDLWIEQQTYAELSMKVKTVNYERDLRMRYWGKGKDKSLIRIVFPPKEKGVSTLKAGKDVYNYAPKIARTTKISEALMSQSWMGSHLSNSDLVRATRLRDDYDAKLQKKEGSGADEVWVIEATAKPDTVTLQRRLVIHLNRKTRLPIKQLFFDKDQTLLRTISYHDVKNYSGKQVPSRIHVTPALPEQKGEFTEIVYSKIDRKKKISDNLFSLTQLADQ